MRYFLLGVLSYLPLLFVGNLRDHTPLFLLLVAVALLFMVVASRAARRGGFPTVWIAATALAVRIMLIPGGPTLSEDVYRYLWDGMLTSRGIDPYSRPPNQFVHLQQEYPDLSSRLKHKGRTSIYPPVAQAFFWLSNRLWGPSVRGWKLLLLIADALIFWLLLRGFRVPPGRIILWSLNPLVVIETFSSGHMDVLAVLFVLAGFYCLKRVQESETYRLGAGAFWATAVNVKLFPLVAVPLLLGYAPVRRFWKRLGSYFLLSLAVPILIVLILWPPAASVSGFVEVLHSYADKWQFNSLPYYLFQTHRQTLHMWLNLFFAAAIALFSLFPRRPSFSDLVVRYYCVLLIFCATASALHPWYVLWVLCAVPLLDLNLMAGLYLAGGVFLSYLFYWFTPPGERVGFLLLEFVPFYTLFLEDLRQYHEHRP